MAAQTTHIFEVYGRSKGHIKQTIWTSLMLHWIPYENTDLKKIVFYGCVVSSAPWGVSRTGPPSRSMQTT